MAKANGDLSRSNAPSFTQKLASVCSREARELEARLAALEHELVSLPVPVGVPTSARLGWHSRILRAPDEPVWVQIDLGRDLPLEAVAVVPASGNLEAQGGPAYGFPRRFRLELTDDESFTKPTSLGDFTHADVPNPGAFPFFVKLQGQRGRYFRLTVTKAWARRDDWVVALGEIMILSAGRNVAAGAGVSTSSASESRPGWLPENLTDGQSLLGPPVSREPSPSSGYLALRSKTVNTIKWAQVDLGRDWPIEEVRLFPARPPNFADSPGTGFPVRFRIETAHEAAFAQPRVLFDTGENDFINPGENPVTFRGDNLPARFVRVTATSLQDSGPEKRFALAELEVWSGGTNRALGACASALDSFTDIRLPRWQPAYLVDGFNSRYRILDLSTWLTGLHRRYEIGQELIQLQQARHSATEAALTLAARAGAGGAGGLAVLAGWLLWRARTAKRLAVEELRTRIASDLHDDIGSQLGSIALTAQLAARDASDPGAMREHLTEIERTARETTEAMHDMIWLLNPASANLAELITRLRETAATQLRDREYRFEVSGASTPRPLSIAFTRNVYLLFKETLTNVLKHSGAKTVAINLAAHNGVLIISVRDNGVGFDPAKATSGHGLDNMRRRSAQLGGTLKLLSTPGQETTIELSVPLS